MHRTTVPYNFRTVSGTDGLVPQADPQDRDPPVKGGNYGDGHTGMGRVPGHGDPWYHTLFSILLFVVVLLSYFMGWIQPTGLPLQR